MYLKVLIIGSGGREHALGWKIRKSPLAGNIYFAPGNGGTSFIGENVPLGATDINGLLKFAKERSIDLTIVGPEAALAEGIVDLFQKEGLQIFGPTKSAARLEWDKDWAAQFLEKYNIPHPQSFTFTSALKAKEFLRLVDPLKVVVKASGLAAGKGVLLPNSLQEGHDAIERIMVRKEFGAAGDKIVIQERLLGPELTIHALSDGKTIIPLLSTQDHKRVFDNDIGPNTGGMGAYAPVPIATEKLMAVVYKEILKPTVEGMKKEGIPFIGVLYAGLMITADGPKVLEFNCRFGDPETQPLMMLLQSDLLINLYSCTNGTLDKQDIKFKNGSSVCVVLASKGYPGKFAIGEVIKGMDKPFLNSIQPFHAGTKMQEDKVITDGGRVIGVTSYAPTFSEARKHIYSAIGKNGLYFKDMHYRKDIAAKAYKYNKTVNN